MQLPLADLLRQSVYSRIAGYEDVNDAERLSQDPTFRLIRFGEDLGAWRGADFSAAIIRDGEPLTQEGNLAGLAAINRQLIAEGGKP